MFRTVKPKKATAQKVAFEYFAPHAKSVELAGNFNNWNPAKTPLKQEHDGKWKVTLELGPGRYEYRYRIDGQWHNDQRPVECVPNPYGSWNCVLQIS